MTSTNDISSKSTLLKPITGVKHIKTDHHLDAVARKNLEIETILNAAQLGYWKLNLKTLVAERSLLHDQIFGYSSRLTEWTYELFLTHVHPDDRSDVKDLIHTAIENKSHCTFECRIYRADDRSLHWISVSIQFSDINKSKDMLMLVQDITERKNIEADFSESEARWKFALATAGHGVWDWHVPEKIIYFSHEWKSMLGYTDDEIKNQQSEFESRVHPEDLNRVWKCIHDYFEQKTNEYVCEVRFRCKDGSYKWVLDRGKVINRAPDGTVLRVIGTHTDISVLKKGEEELKLSQIDLKESLLYNRNIIEANISPIVVINNEGKISDANKAAELALDVSREKLLGTDLSLYFTDTEYAKKAYLTALSQGYVKNHELTLGSSGKTSDVLYNAAVMKHPDGSSSGVIATLTNVSELKQAQIEARSSALSLMRSNKELQQFAYSASHDLQEPLRSISNYLLLIERRYKDKLDQDANDFINYAVEGANRLQQMINSLLVFSRIETKGAPFTKTNLNTVVKCAMELLYDSIKSSDAIILYDELPSLMVDEDQLIICFQNLISNSIKFCKAEEPPKIHISAINKGHEWLFSVSDNGIGIDLKYKDKLFIMFKRLVGREYPGNGMGLAICKKVIERHGGRIWVDSELGKGSTFYFTIPNLENSNEI